MQARMGSVRKIDGKVRRINRQLSLFLLVFCVILILWLILLGIILYSDQKNVERYQVQNYERLAKNRVRFDALCASTQAYVDSFEDTQYVLPAFDQADRGTITESLLDPASADVPASEDYLFILDTMMYKMNTRLQVLGLAAGSFTSFAAFNTASGVGIAVAERSSSSLPCLSAETLQRFLGIDPAFVSAPDGGIVGATPTDYSKSRLYVVRRIGENSLLLCGMSDEAIRDTLLVSDIGRSYQVVDIACVFRNGDRIARNGVNELQGLDLRAIPAEGETIEHQSGVTIMRLPVESIGGAVIATMLETGATNISTNVEFVPMLILNVLWMLVVLCSCFYLIFFVFRPLRLICSQLPHDEESLGQSEFSAISRALGSYQEQLTSDQNVIRQQQEQLRIAYLKALTQGVRLMLTPEQLDALSIPALLRQYVLVTLYPEDGLWAEPNMSEQESRYMRHVARQIIREQASGCLRREDFECLTFDSYAILVLPVADEAEEAAIRAGLESLIVACRLHFRKKFGCGVSAITQGEDHFEDAYYGSIHGGIISEDRELSDQADADLRKQSDLSFRLSRLIYVEEYSQAQAVFEELLDEIFGIKNHIVRKQRLRGQLDLVSCMLLEANQENRKYLSSADPGVYELVHLEDQEEILSKWTDVFHMLEEIKQARIRQAQPHYSGQFEQIYQYVLANFRDPNLSLSMLAERFGMKGPSLSREFQKNLGHGFLEEVHHLRIDAAKQEIAGTDATLSDIAERVGYTNTLTMTRAFKKYEGRLPSSFREETAE